jgi:tRNA1Val (adenine37-N6)-methyltransferase
VIDLTCEEPAPGLKVWQPRRGFRYGLDPFLLAGWVLEGGRPKNFLDVGTGSGIVALLLARAGIPGVGIDVRREWIDLAQRSAAESGLANVSFVHGDIRSARLDAADLVVANPPYRGAGQGTMSPDPGKAAATHELAGTLDELVEAMCRVGDRVALVLPIQREAEARDALARARRAPRRLLRFDHTLALIEGAKAPSTLHVEVAAIREEGTFSERVRTLYARTGARLAPAEGGV